MSPLMMLQVRGAIQWLISLGTVSWCLPGPTPATPVKFFGEKNERLYLLLRGAVYWSFMMLWWTALTSMPLGDATTIVYCGPVFTAIFAWMLLGEQVPRNFLCCLALNMGGVCLITQPDFLFGKEGGNTAGAGYLQGTLCAVAGAVMCGLLPSLVRLSKGCHWSTVEHVTALTSMAVFTPVAIGLWAGIDSLKFGKLESDLSVHWTAGGFALLVGVAVFEFIGLGLQTYGYQREQAARASLMAYLEIPFSYMLQYLVWGDLLTWLEGVGMVLIITSGLINLYPQLKASWSKTEMVAKPEEPQMSEVLQ